MGLYTALRSALEAVMQAKEAQQTIPGMRPLKGAVQIPGKPGLWYVDPARLSERGFLGDAAKEVQREGALAETYPGNDLGAKHAGMTLGALESLAYAANPMTKNSEVKGLMQIGKSGKLRGAAAMDTGKARELLDPDGLDFTTDFPNYLDYVGTLSPEVRGRDLMRQLQDILGNKMVFQVYNPKKNRAIYEKMGAKPLPPNDQGLDALEGSVNLPAYGIDRPIPAPLPYRDLRQLDLPDMASGGLLRGKGVLR